MLPRLQKFLLAVKGATAVPRIQRDLQWRLKSLIAWPRRRVKAPHRTRSRCADGSAHVSSQLAENTHPPRWTAMESFSSRWAGWSLLHLLQRHSIARIIRRSAHASTGRWCTRCHVMHGDELSELIRIDRDWLTWQDSVRLSRARASPLLVCGDAAGRPC